MTTAASPSPIFLFTSGDASRSFKGVPDHDDFITFLALDNDWATAIGVAARG